jgi:hypothetical protein
MLTRHTFGQLKSSEYPMRERGEVRQHLRIGSQKRGLERKQ